MWHLQEIPTAKTEHGSPRSVYGSGEELTAQTLQREESSAFQRPELPAAQCFGGDEVPLTTASPRRKKHLLQELTSPLQLLR